jgi:hypothetical protein
VRNRRTYEAMTVGGIFLVAMAQTAWKELAPSLRDVIAWDDARLADPQRRLRREREAKSGQSAAS